MIWGSRTAGIALLELLWALDLQWIGASPIVTEMWNGNINRLGKGGETGDGADRAKILISKHLVGNGGIFAMASHALPLTRTAKCIKRWLAGT